MSAICSICEDPSHHSAACPCLHDALNEGFFKGGGPGGHYHDDDEDDSSKYTIIIYPSETFNSLVVEQQHSRPPSPASY
jgi:hypothetical protein